ncbi:hypothetical protein BC826DRAFT_449676 [Russula brevipes]|nr:hypothetical protein BC826DRAFT_449676 [Russula brevipes]
MAAGLSTLTRLEELSIHFRSPRSRPGQLSPPRSTRAVLPALNYFEFRGVNEYLEDLTSRIDAPLLKIFRITFFNQLVFNTPRLGAFISHVEKLRSQSQAHITFSHDDVILSFMADGHGRPALILTIRCKGSDWQLSSLTQFVPMRGIYAACRVCLARALWGKNNGGITRATKNFPARVLAIGTCQGGPCAVSRCTEVFRSPCGRESAGAGVNVLKTSQRCRVLSAFIPLL